MPYGGFDIVETCWTSGRPSWSWLRLVLRQLKQRLRWLLRKQTVQAVQAEAYQVQLHHRAHQARGTWRMGADRGCQMLLNQFNSSGGIVEAQLIQSKIPRYRQIHMTNHDKSSSRLTTRRIWTCMAIMASYKLTEGRGETWKNQSKNRKEQSFFRTSWLFGVFWLCCLMTLTLMLFNVV